MTTANNSKDQQPHGLGNLAQISEKTNLQHVLDIYREKHYGETKNRPLPFCIVRDHGTQNECLVGNFSTWRNAMNYIERHSTDDDCHRYEIFEYTANFELTQEWTK